jgi:hypothetical protein
VNRLATLFGRGHAPDIENLSALVDRQLDVEAARNTEAHVATCAVCAAEVEGMRRVKAMLAAMPELDAPRSFRLRPSDVAVPRRPTRGAASGAMRWAPALSGVAAALFLVVLGTDFATRDGAGERDGGSRLTAAGSAPNLERAADATLGESSDNSENFGLTDAPAGAVAPPDDDGDQGVVPASTACDAVTDVEPPIGVPDFDPCPELGRNLADPQQYDSGATPAAGDIAPADDGATKQAERIEALSADGDGDGNRTAFLIVEIIVGALAAAAIATYIVSRRTRSEG